MTIKTGIDLLGFNGQERMMEAVDRTADTLKSIGYRGKDIKARILKAESTA